jgi:BASS family bile acid:Na+ symporter
MSKFLSYGILISIALAIIFPIGEQLKFLIPFILALTIFFSFLKIDSRFKDFLHKEILFYSIIQFVILPTIIFFSTRFIQEELRLGIFIVSMTPIAFGSVIVTDIIKGNHEISLSTLIVSNFLSPLVYPVLFMVFYGSSIQVSSLQIFIKVLLMIFVPFLVSVVVKKFKKVKDKLCAISKIFNPIAMMLIVFTGVSASSAKLKSMELSSLSSTIIVIVILAIVSYFIGWNLSKDKKKRKSLALSQGYKNTGLAIWLSLSNFSAVVSIPATIYIICHHLINTILISRFSKKKEFEEQE